MLRLRSQTLLLTLTLTLGPLLFSTGFSMPLHAQEKTEAEGITQNLNQGITYGKNGFTFTRDDGLFSLSIQNRIQFRYANPFDSDPRSVSDLEQELSSFMIRRARTKLNGHAYFPWLKYYLQYDWKDPVLRDFRITLDKYPWASVWVGRSKVLYNDERVTSSGKQQFVNRSIVNDIFTVDRQEGVQLFGNVFPDSGYDFSYATGVFTGLGVGERGNDDINMMYTGRLQWNILGGEMAFSQSDLKVHEKPVLSVAVAAATNQSRCTTFATSQESCRSLPGWQVGEAGQYRLNQMMEEIRFKWQGLSIKHELHSKTVTDTLNTSNNSSTHLLGSLVQVGYFPHQLWSFIPKELEIAGRYAFVDPNTAQTRDLQQEFSGIITYFLQGHDNKLSFQISHLTVEDEKANQAAQRLWLQWELSF